MGLLRQRQFVQRLNGQREGEAGASGQLDAPGIRVCGGNLKEDEESCGGWEYPMKQTGQRQEE